MMGGDLLGESCMPFELHHMNLVFPKTVYEFSNGTTAEYPGQPFSAGHFSNEYPDRERRKRPLHLTGPEGMTSHGGLAYEKYLKGVFNATYDAYGTKVYYIDQDASAYISAGSPSPPPYDDAWKRKLLQEVKDQKVNMAQTMAEYRQAQEMFVKNTKIIVKVLRGLRKGDVPSVFDALGLPRKKLHGTISDRWLELQYGWKPLLQDLHGICDEVARNATVARVRKIKTRTRALTDVVRDGPAIPGSPFPTTAHDTYNVVSHVTCYLRMTSHTSTRLGFTNPIDLAWELLPYSFVIDWLIPIGDWLNAMDAAVGLEDCYGTVAHKAKIISTTSLGGYYLRTWYTRSTFTGLPSNPLPSYSPSVGVGRIANAIALLTQLKAR
jgi:hypothetical protein